MRESFAFEGTTEAPRKARQALTRLVSGAVPGDLLGRMLLMTSEIVTNAFLHGGKDDRNDIHLTVEVNRLHARVAVSDAGAASAPAMRSPDPEAVSGGFGLFLVDQLSDRWGVVRDGRGTTVYFEVDTVDPPRPKAATGSRRSRTTGADGGSRRSARAAGNTITA